MGRGFIVRDLPWTKEKLRDLRPFEFSPSSPSPAPAAPLPFLAEVPKALLEEWQVGGAGW